jgi:DNA-binding CsgD family transcriptional regulator
MRMSQVADFYYALDQIRNSRELLGLFKKTTAPSGIEGIFIAHLPSAGDDIAPNVMLRGWNEDWIFHHARQNYVLHDPLDNEPARRETICVGGEICRERKPSRLESQIMREAKSAGLHDGSTVPVVVTGLRTTCVSFPTAGSFDRVSFDREGRQTLQLVATLAVAKLDALIAAPPAAADAPPSVKRLAPRERECLALAGQGLTSKEIERQIGLSFRTVDFYIGRAMHKLNARTRTEALSLALKHRLIDV